METKEIPPLIQNLSYSGINELHSCPRKFVLNKLRAPDRADTRSVTFAFGHAVGTGIQSTMEGKSDDQIMLDMFLAWDYPDLYAEEEKANKSFWSAVIAVRRFKQVRDSNLLCDYELAVWDGKPCVELGFRVTTPDGYKYRGFVDLVLRHKDTRELLVLELKTTSSQRIEPATYKNSGQALGYSIVLDRIEPGNSSYKVLYLVLSSKDLEYTALPFTKSFLQRAEWVHAFLLDIEMIKMYWANSFWPQNGQSCFNFFRECEYFQNCGQQMKFLVPPKAWTQQPDNEDEKFSIELTLLDLIEGQLEKNEEPV